MMRPLAALLLLSAAACATAAEAVIEDRLEAIGLSEQKADCMGGELRARLDADDLTTLARHTYTVSRADSPGEVVDALAGIDDFTIARAVVASGTACLFSAR